MGTTLTGTTPQDTYDSLIKVTDNGPLSGTAKYLSDGLGNDSVLALSTTAVGINTSTPEANLHISGDANNRAVLRLASTSANRLAAVTFYGNNVESAVIGYEGGSEIISGGVQGDLIIRNVLAGKDIILDTNAGNVGIGTSSPASKLTVRPSDNDGILISSSNDSHTGFFYFGDASSNTVGSISYDHFSDVMRFNTGAAERFRITANGVTFNGDTAAANALDDYEEGTWTMGVSFGGGSTGVTYSINTGSYTKIGRKVTVTGYVVLTSKGTDTGVARITGLPFTIAGATGNFSAPTLYLQNITFANAFQGFGVNGATTIAIYEVTEAGAVSTISNNDFSDTSEIILSFTYFV